MNNFKKLTTVFCCTAVVLSLSSCETLKPRPAGKLPLPPLVKDDYKLPVDFQELKNKPVADDLRSKIELFPARNEFSDTPTVAKHRRTVTNGVGTYSLNFDEADLGEVAKVILGDILEENYILSPKVAGKVTLNTTQPLTKEELVPTLEMVLRMNNAALVKDGNIFHIEPATEALYTSDVSSGPAARAGYQTRVITIRNVDVKNVADIIKPLVRDKTILNIDPTRNSMVVTGTPDEMARVMDMVSTFDTDLLRGRSFALFSLAHVEPEKVIEELNAIFGKKGGKTDDNEFFRFIPIERMNAVLAITHQSSYLRDIEDWVFRLDKANSASGGGVNVYRVQNVDAVDLADQLNAIFGTGGGSSKKDKAGKVAPGQSAGDMTNKSSSSSDSSSSDSSLSGNSSSSMGSSMSSSSKKSSRSSGSGSTGSAKVANVGDVRIVADEANNSVVVVSTEREYKVILPIIKQLDIMPLQVLIDATIADVTLTDGLSYGISWYLNNGAKSGRAQYPDIGTANLSNLGAGFASVLGASNPVAGLAYSFLSNSGDIQMLLHAEATKSHVNVISSPSLMVLNNQEASILVGDEISLVTGTLSGATGAGTGSNGLINNTQQQQRKTGVKLKVKPRVNASGVVILDIQQSIEDIGTKAVGATNPTIKNREINSTVAVQSGETLVLGGLIKETNKNSKGGIPFLHTLPVIGPLFGGTEVNKERTELVVLITPRVVKTLQDTRVVTDEFRRKLTGLYENPNAPRHKKEWYEKYGINR